MTRSTAGAVALILAAVQYLVVEAVAASAWTAPPYSYGANNISDLGVPSQSPLSGVMNTGFVLHGVLFVAAALLLVRPLGRLCLALVVVHGVGITLVALVPASPDGTVVWHGVGAGMAIIGGNAAWVAFGGRARAWPWVALGVLGLVSLVLFQTVTWDENAWFERGAVYPIQAGELLAGLVLLHRPQLFARRGAPAS